jgi:hypothetical protein
MTAKFVGLSGTTMRKSFRDFAHIARWALRENAPVPASEYEVDQWADAIDEKVGELDRKEPGALSALCPEVDPPPTLAQLREGFRRRLLETPGVIAAVSTTDEVEAAIHIKPIKYELKPEMDEHFRRLRKLAVTPGDWSLSEAVDIWRHARELALGLYYRWSPYPPDDWREARKEWSAFVRNAISRHHKLDSELQVTQACDAGLLPSDELEAWRYERDRPRPEFDNKKFTYETVPVWIDDSALNVVANWMAKRPGVVWVEHGFFGEALAKLTGAPYFRRKGFDAQRRSISDPALTPWLKERSVILSRKANSEGLNIQDKWDRMLFTTPNEGADVLHQAIARLHRDGFEGDVAEHHRAIVKAQEMAAVIRDTMGGTNKLLQAEIDWPDEDEVARWPGWRWR